MLAREHVKALVDRLTENQLQALLVILNSMAHHSQENELDRDYEEDRVWLDDDLRELPPYNWGPEGVPEGQPVRYCADEGLLVVGGKKRG